MCKGMLYEFIDAKTGEVNNKSDGLKVSVTEDKVYEYLCENYGEEHVRRQVAFDINAGNGFEGKPIKERYYADFYVDTIKAVIEVKGEKQKWLEDYKMMKVALRKPMLLAQDKNLKEELIGTKFEIAKVIAYVGWEVNQFFYLNSNKIEGKEIERACIIKRKIVDKDVIDFTFEKERGENPTYTKAKNEGKIVLDYGEKMSFFDEPISDIECKQEEVKSYIEIEDYDEGNKNKTAITIDLIETIQNTYGEVKEWGTGLKYWVCYKLENDTFIEMFENKEQRDEKYKEVLKEIESWKKYRYGKV